MTKNPEPAARHWSTSDWGSMDWDPELSAVQIQTFAPDTFDALIALYCQDLDDAAPKYRGRHVETVAVNGRLL